MALYLLRTKKQSLTTPPPLVAAAAPPPVTAVMVPLQTASVSAPSESEHEGPERGQTRKRHVQWLVRVVVSGLEGAVLTYMSVCRNLKLPVIN